MHGLPARCLYQQSLHGPIRSSDPCPYRCGGHRLHGADRNLGRPLRLRTSLHHRSLSHGLLSRYRLRAGRGALVSSGLHHTRQGGGRGSCKPKTFMSMTRRLHPTAND
jgi:hypothetical protein